MKCDHLPSSLPFCFFQLPGGELSWVTNAEWSGWQAGPMCIGPWHCRVPGFRSCARKAVSLERIHHLTEQAAATCQECHVPGVPSGPERMVGVRELSKHSKPCQFATIKQQDSIKQFAVAERQPDVWSVYQARLPALCLTKNCQKRKSSGIPRVGDGDLVLMGARCGPLLSLCAFPSDTSAFCLMQT